jgi:hypothetical protein
MRRALLLVVGLFAILLQPMTSSGQESSTAQLQAFTRSSFYEGLIVRTFAALPEAVFKRCPTFVSNGSTVTVIKPVTFATDGFPNAGQWVQTFPVSGCGNDTTFNIYFSATVDEKINTLIAAPGTTRADPILQNDAFRFATIGALLVAKDCKTFLVKNTKFEGFGATKLAVHDPGPGAQLRPWWETWTMVGCGRTFDVPLDFVPNAKGTQIVQPGGAIER